METLRALRVLLTIQAAYILVTALWPLVHLETFLIVTGYKTDLWLVKTVGALLIPIACCLFSFLVFETDKRPAFILGSLTAVAFATIDFYYALNHQISKIYLLDGAIEIVFLIAWIYIAMKLKLATK
jgi:hypothetical protein